MRGGVIRRAVVALSCVLVATALFIDGTVAQLPDPGDLLDLPDVTLEEVLELTDIEAPPEGVGVFIHSDYPLSDPLLLDDLELTSITFDITPAGVVEVRNGTTTDGTTGANAEPTCSDRAYKAYGVSWTQGRMPIAWRYDKRSVPGYLNKRKVRRRIKRGFAAWAKPRTGCDNAQTNDLSFSYGGITGRGPALDDVNAVDFASKSSGPLGTTYTWYVAGDIIEFDLRLNSAYRWTVWRKARRRYQIQNVVAHEGGHAVGLDDLSDPHGKLTMFGRIRKGERKKQRLGRGDLLGAQDISP